MSRKTILSVIALAIAAVITLSLCSCQSEYDDPKYSDPNYFYTREYIESVKDGSRFATSRSDGDLDALLHIYDDVRRRLIPSGRESLISEKVILTASGTSMVIRKGAKN